MDIPGLQEKGGENKGGRRHHKSAKRVSAKTIRRTLKRLGMRPKGRLVLKGGGGGDGVAEEKKQEDMAAGRRRHGGRSASASMSSNKKGKKSRRRSKRSLSIPGLGKLPF